MIKFLGEGDGRPMLGFGLSRKNCEKLLEGKPIFIDLKVMLMNSKVDVNDATVLLFGGEDESSMQETIAPLLGKHETKTHHEEN